MSPGIYEWAATVTARHWTANHPWNSHSPAAIREGASPEAVQSLAEGRRPVETAEDEEQAHDYLHEPWANQHITNATHDRASADQGFVHLYDPDEHGSGERFAPIASRRRWQRYRAVHVNRLRRALP